MDKSSPTPQIRMELPARHTHAADTAQRSIERYTGGAAGQCGHLSRRGRAGWGLGGRRSRGQPPRLRECSRDRAAEL